MSGAPMDWQADDQASFGEGVARSGCCHAPLTLCCGLTLITVKCGHCGKLAEHHSIWPEDFAAA